jgi:hypothetical protein
MRYLNVLFGIALSLHLFSQTDTVPITPSYDIKTAVVSDSIFSMIQKRYIGLKIIISSNDLMDDSACPYHMDSEKPTYKTWQCTRIERNKDGLTRLGKPSFNDEANGFLTLTLASSDGTCALTDLFIFNFRHKVFTPSQFEKLKVKFGAKTFSLLLNGKLQIGMSKEMVLWSWGEPDHVHTTTNANAKREQWVYDNDYLYFDNGILTTIQN